MTTMLKKYYKDSAKLNSLNLNEEEYASIIISEASNLFEQQLLKEESKLFKLFKKQYLRSWYGG